MIREGDVVAFPFPQADQAGGKLRPALVLRACPGRHDDWLVCMVSSQVRHHLPGFDELVRPEDDDFGESGLRVPSVVRISRLAVVASSVFQGRLGQLGEERVARIRQRLVAWLARGVACQAPADDCGPATAV